MLSDDLREVKRATKAVKEIAQEIAKIIGGQPPAPPPFAPSRHDRVKYIAPPRVQRQQRKPGQLPEDYSFVTCIKCDIPTVVVRDNRQQCFASCCLRCSTISYFETIVEEKEND